eukprot:4915057-Alexandrium_andersonii.AAC.1
MAGPVYELDQRWLGLCTRIVNRIAAHTNTLGPVHGPPCVRACVRERVPVLQESPVRTCAA